MTILIFMILFHPESDTTPSISYPGADQKGFYLQNTNLSPEYFILSFDFFSLIIIFIW